MQRMRKQGFQFIYYVNVLISIKTKTGNEIHR
jgi:hypothetical protein